MGRGKQAEGMGLAEQKGDADAHGEAVYGMGCQQLACNRVHSAFAHRDGTRTKGTFTLPSIHQPTSCLPALSLDLPLPAVQVRAMLAVPYFEKALYELPEDQLTPDTLLALADEIEVGMLCCAVLC